MLVAGMVWQRDIDITKKEDCEMATCYLDKNLESMNKNECADALKEIDEVRSQIVWRMQDIERGDIPTCADCGELLEEGICPLECEKYDAEGNRIA